MKPLQQLLANATRSDRTIVLSEGADPRIAEGAVRARKDGIASIILVGEEETVQAQLAAQGGTGLSGIKIHDPATSPLRDELTTLYHDLRRHRGISLQDAADAVRRPHLYAALMVRAGHADGTVGGAVTTTAEIVRAAIQIIGPAKDTKLVSSFFLMLLCDDHHAKKGAYIFADCGLVIDPTADEMAEIACASAASLKALVAKTPRIAMLSFSTLGSARHDAVSKVATATEMVRTRAPELQVDGELQFDAAFVPDVAAAKAPDSPLDGNANIFVFPNLDAGNIGYKIAQRIGGAVALGPVLQGLAKPANDLSRGCSAEDVLHMIAVTAAQAEAVE